MQPSKAWSIYFKLLGFNDFKFNSLNKDIPLNILCMFSKFGPSKLERSKLFKFLSPENIKEVSTTFEKTKLFDNFKVLKEVHPSNILFIFWTFLVTKLFNSKLANSLHCLNIKLISWTFSVLKKLISNFLKLPHCENILLILVTLLVTNLSWEKIISVKEEHPSNISLISFTFLVSKLDKSNICKDSSPLNIPAIFSTFAVFNLLKSKLCNLLLANIYDISFILFKDNPVISISWIPLFRNRFFTEVISEVSQPLIVKADNSVQSSKTLFIEVIFKFLAEVISILIKSWTPLNILSKLIFS